MRRAFRVYSFEVDKVEADIVVIIVEVVGAKYTIRSRLGYSIKVE